MSSFEAYTFMDIFSRSYGRVVSPRVYGVRVLEWEHC
jgi:hypothetical protein